MSKKLDGIIKSDNTEYAVKVIGATLNNDGKSLLKIINNPDTHDEVKFCALTGAFHLIGKNKKELRDMFDIDYRDEFKLIRELLEKFETILKTDNYKKYPIAVLPETKITKAEFISESFGEIFGFVFNPIFSGGYSQWEKDESFMLPSIVESLFRIIIENQVIDSDEFVLTTVSKQVNLVIDEVYQDTFSNSKNKIWDSKRAAREYFLRKIIVFNPIIPTKTKDAVNKRWQAWFLLEDNYKTTGKKVNKKILLSEVENIYKII